MVVVVGSYCFVLNISFNDVLGVILVQGFVYDVDVLIWLVDWNQFGYDVNVNDQKGGFWWVYLIGVEMVVVVLELVCWVLMLLGLLGLSLLVWWWC